MAILVNKAAHEELAKTVGRRLKAARLAAKVGEQEAADAIGHKNATQICLAEKGEARIPPLMSLCQFADLYGVSIDYLSGRIDDALADPFETNQGAIKRAFVNNMSEYTKQYMDAIADFAAKSVADNAVASMYMGRLIERAEEIMTAYTRMKEVNPHFEDEIRGSARLEAAIKSISDIAQGAANRVCRDGKNGEVQRMEIHLDATKFCLTPQ